ncbi:carbohydrate-binding module family 14 protein [Roseibacterium sp. SDUM158017]|uniref:carbohydrate-binding module family 14 protein n=1 Tax=Roseicyclus salinarum TaxID=3036773 RepID=UPI0024152815|nr:carbohydrate-binding module family 14 protein [Roseibacterium sp. SDUM158017]MDG4648067.1 carbohydrate-binding module family 14 protein [Roseibacterium sp. SDUM158017]
MSIKTILAAFVLAAAPGLAMAECSWGSMQQTTMSCSDGTSWDAATQSCVPTASS